MCSKSYGLNVANMAGLPSAIVDRAETKATELETTCNGTNVTLPLTKDTHGVRQLCDLLDVDPPLPATK